jgi:SAM-dependent methyltransferase
MDGYREIAVHYELGLEDGRLFRNGEPRLEFVRTMELLERFLPLPPQRVLDVGGGTGIYAAQLAMAGYQVHLVDLIERHVNEATARAALQPANSFSAAVGDARQLKEDDQSYDVVLLPGPLYHLVERSDRLGALREARRVLRPGGLVMAATISRFASLLDGLKRNLLSDPEFRPIVERDLLDGQHRNADPAGRPEFFTTAYFHHPGEIAGEFEEADLRVDGVFGIEGPGWLLEKEWDDPTSRQGILFASRVLEQEPTALALNSHLLGVGRRA